MQEGIKRYIEHDYYPLDRIGEDEYSALKEGLPGYYSIQEKILDEEAEMRASEGWE